MQSTNSPTLTDLDWWWPSPQAFDDLEVTDLETGWQLSAPDHTELGEWLNFWSQSEAHHEMFQTYFLAALTKHADLVIDDLNNDGKNENIPHGRHTDSEQAQEHLAG